MIIHPTSGCEDNNNKRLLQHTDLRFWSRRHVEQLSHRAVSSLGLGLVGRYVHGSLASGGFDPETSDIDFLVGTAGRLPGETVAALKEMHACLGVGGSKWFQKLEGAYLLKDDLRRHDPSHPPAPWLGVDGHFALETLGPDWILPRWIRAPKAWSSPARWAMGSLGEPWAALIAAAVRCRPGMGFNRFKETDGLIRYTLKRWGLLAGNQTQA